MPSLLEIPELSSLRLGHGLVRIPCERDIPFTRRVRRLVDAAGFRRLNQISQLGLVSLVYPGATHTRFEHSLGVFGNAVQYLMQLASDERFTAHVSPHGAEVLLCAALLHDVGHWPYCHAIEDMKLPGAFTHEQFAADIIRGDDDLRNALRQDWSVDPAEVLHLLDHTGTDAEQRLLSSILSGPIDVDKLDYLDRDSLHCGVPYGRNFDRQRLIRCLTVNDSEDGLALLEKGKTAAELMVFARYVMFGEVYWHHAVRAATCMLCHCFARLIPAEQRAAFFAMSEAEAGKTLLAAGVGTCYEPLTAGIFGDRRLLFKRVAEFRRDQQGELYARLAGRPFLELVEKSRELVLALRSVTGLDIAESEVLIDAPPPHREVEFDIQLFSPKEQRYRRLADVSPVVGALARQQFDDYVKRVRVFCHPRWLQSLPSTTLEAALVEVTSA